MEIPVNHPYWHVRRLAEDSSIARFNFSYYHYRPQSLVDERTYFTLSCEQFLNASTMSDVIVNCPAECELAIHSTVMMNNNDVLHIPMIDMSTQSKAHILRLSTYLDPNLFNKFSWYASGRSFHGYGGTLLSQTDWTKLMGVLLLSNQKNLAPTVDTRWIGHRLVAGYSALRWTKNTGYYIGTPRELAML